MKKDYTFDRPYAVKAALEDFSPRQFYLACEETGYIPLPGIEQLLFNQGRLSLTLIDRLIERGHQTVEPQ